MKTTFADASFFVAYLNGRDDAHGAARKAMIEPTGRILTTPWVLAEAGNWAAAKYRREFCALLNALDADKRFDVCVPSESDFLAGRSLYCAHLDKGWSLVDCISFAIMRDARIRDALTTDHHFRPAGFQVLL